MNKSVVITSDPPPSEIEALIDKFLTQFAPFESGDGRKLILLKDERSQAFYIPCHLKAEDIAGKTDFFASIDDSDEDELYKLNRDITENETAFAAMVLDAKNGRTFEDIVVEYDTTYNSEFPLKIYGGQHRIKAIDFAKDTKPEILHGFRIYFGLTRNQKVEIASINNTSIAVSNDLLDRMKEQLMGSELRDFCQKVGLLDSSQDFADRKDAVIPTVRIARTLVVNYWKGKNANDDEFHQPIVCKSGGIDPDYQEVRQKIDWNDEGLLEVGRNYAKLNETQRSKTMNRGTDKNSEYARKALSMSVVASWSYAAGFYTRNKTNQSALFNIVNNLGDNDDPLNAKALSTARLKGIDPDTYRGLGTRTSADELGRMLEVFFVFSEKAPGKRITRDLANAAIQSFEAKKATNRAAKSLSRI